MYSGWVPLCSYLRPHCIGQPAINWLFIALDQPSTFLALFTLEKGLIDQILQNNTEKSLFCLCHDQHFIWAKQFQFGGRPRKHQMPLDGGGGMQSCDFSNQWQTGGFFSTGALSRLAFRGPSNPIPVLGFMVIWKVNQVRPWQTKAANRTRSHPTFK